MSFRKPRPSLLPYLVIDGYNLMHAMGLARKNYGSGDLERCRNQMERALQRVLSEPVLAHTTIVYDAFSSASDINRYQESSGIAVVFAPRGTDADSEIERILKHHSAPTRVLVVSSDHRLHKAASRRRAKCVDSEEFWDSLEESSSQDSHSAASQVSLSQPPPSVSEDFGTDYLTKLQDELDHGDVK